MLDVRVTLISTEVLVCDDIGLITVVVGIVLTDVECEDTILGRIVVLPSTEILLGCDISDGITVLLSAEVSFTGDTVLLTTDMVGTGVGFTLLVVTICDKSNLSVVGVGDRGANVELVVKAGSADCTVRVVDVDGTEESSVIVFCCEVTGLSSVAVSS